jgi:hypothetical protein
MTFLANRSRLLLLAILLFVLAVSLPLPAQSAPHIDNASPLTATAGTPVTGSGFGAAQGSGNVWMGNTYGVVVNWSDHPGGGFWMLSLFSRCSTLRAVASSHFFPGL